MRRSGVLLSFLPVAILALAACGESELPGSGDGALADYSADCVGGLVVDGVWYQPDWNSPVPDESDLGDVFATVEGPWDCYIAPEELGDGVFATGIPSGSEVRVIGTRTSDEALATVSAGGVAVFRSGGSMSLASALGDEIVAIGINSEYDGTTRFATIDDPDVIARLVDVASAVDQESSLDGLSEGERYFIEFVHPDDLFTSFPYGVERAQLYDRIVGAVWAEAIATAMAESGGSPNVDGLSVTASGVETPTHPLGACRLDRTDLAATPGEIITVAGDAVADDVVEPWWWINPPGGVGETVPAPSQTGPGLLMPNVDGAMIVEIYLRTGSTSGHSAVEACFTLESTGAIDDADGAVPTDSLDCTAESSEPTFDQYDDTAASYPTISEAATEWFTRTAIGRDDIAALQLVATRYDPIVNLVDAEGRSQALARLASDGGASWRVVEASVCTSP